MSGYSKVELDSNKVYIEVPRETESGLVVMILMKQLEAVEEELQRLLEDSEREPSRGEDMVCSVRTRDALIEVINYNLEPSAQIPNKWL